MPHQQKNLLTSLLLQVEEIPFMQKTNLKTVYRYNHRQYKTLTLLVTEILMVRLMYSCRGASSLIVSTEHTPKVSVIFRSGQYWQHIS